MKFLLDKECMTTYYFPIEKVGASGKRWLLVPSLIEVLNFIFFDFITFCFLAKELFSKNAYRKLLN